MKHIEGVFETLRGLSIYYQSWLPKADVKAAVLIVHGAGEHSGRYANVVEHLVPLGYAAHGFDLPGHGRSEGGREFVACFEDFTDTLTEYYEAVTASQPAMPVFLLGHSLGGLIVCNHLLDHQGDFKGAILSAPAIKIGRGISPVLIAMSKILSAVAPRAGLTKLDANAISRDPKVVKTYVDDPLVFHGKTPARFGSEVLKAMLHATAQVSQITLPFIVVQGMADKLVDPGGARMLCEKASSADKTLRLYEGLYHEVFNEPEHAMVLNDIATWLEARV